MMLTVRLRIYFPTLSSSSPWKAPFQRSASLSWTWLRRTFQVKYYLIVCVHFQLVFVINNSFLVFIDCSLATGNPDVHIPLGCVEWSGHASAGAALFGLPWVLHLCKVSPAVIRDSLFVNSLLFSGLASQDFGSGNSLTLLLHKR